MRWWTAVSLAAVLVGLLDGDGLVAVWAEAEPGGELVLQVP